MDPTSVTLIVGIFSPVASGIVAWLVARRIAPDVEKLKTDLAQRLETAKGQITRDVGRDLKHHETRLRVLSELELHMHRQTLENLAPAITRVLAVCSEANILAVDGMRVEAHALSLDEWQRRSRLLFESVEAARDALTLCPYQWLASVEADLSRIAAAASSVGLVREPTVQMEVWQKVEIGARQIRDLARSWHRDAWQRHERMRADLMGDTVAVVDGSA